MRLLLIILLITIPKLLLHSQNFAIACEKTNYLVEGMENPLSIIVENIPCAKLVVTTDNGIIERDWKHPCIYITTPDQYGWANISIKQIKRKDTILVGERSFKVKQIFPHAKVAGIKDSSVIEKSVLQAQYGIYVPSEDYNYDGHYQVLSYRMKFIRDGWLILDMKFNGHSFHDYNITYRASHYLAMLEPGDIVVFYDIYARVLNSTRLITNTVTFLIK